LFISKKRRRFPDYVADRSGLSDGHGKKSKMRAIANRTSKLYLLEAPANPILIAGPGC
jgi:hypothetical protein